MSAARTAPLRERATRYRAGHEYQESAPRRERRASGRQQRRPARPEQACNSSGTLIVALSCVARGKPRLETQVSEAATCSCDSETAGRSALGASLSAARAGPRVLELGPASAWPRSSASWARLLLRRSSTSGPAHRGLTVRVSFQGHKSGAHSPSRLGARPGDMRMKAGLTSQSICCFPNTGNLK